MILVTGACGFIGRNLCRALVAAGHRVIGVHRPGYADALSPGTEPLPCDHGAGAPLVFPEGVEAVVHLAQSSRFREFPDGAQDMFDVNLRTTFHLLEEARRHGVRRFVYASSGGVYGPQPGAFSEAEPMVLQQPLGFYLSTKLCSELLVETYSGLFATAILRIFFAYGPGQTRDRLIPRLVDAVRHGRPIVLQGQEGLRINPIHVDDAVAGFQAALAADEILKANLAGPEVVSLRCIGEILGALVGRPPVFTVEPEPEDPPMLVGDTGLMRDRLAFTPRIGVEEGLRTMVGG